MMDNSNPNSSTTGGGGGGGVDGDNMSQASSQSRSSNLNGSLLDRIKAKQAGGSGTGVEQQTQGQMIVEPAAPTQISIPNYNPTMTNNGGGGAGAGTEARHNIAASNDFSELGASSMMSGLGFGAAQGGGVEGGISESLLGGEHREGDPNYSMGNYFQTFVMDVYNLFQSIPVWAQVIVLALMIFLVVKLI